jgi:hypothetical protein
MASPEIIHTHAKTAVVPSASHEKEATSSGAVSTALSTFYSPLRILPDRRRWCVVGFADS